MKRFIPLALVLCLAFGLVQMAAASETMGADGVLETTAEVLSVDDTEILSSGFSNIGYQTVEAIITEGLYEGRRVTATNTLLGQNDLDEIYTPGDRVVLAVQVVEGDIAGAKTISRDRHVWLWGMGLLLVAALLLYAGMVGFKALLSFVLSLGILWEVLVKGLLAGKEPVLLTAVTVVLLSGIIIFLVSGFTRRGVSAFLGTVGGLMATLAVTHFFGARMGLFGMTQPYVQTLVISGYYHLDLREIFYAAIILGASGAAMDISVDIAASMHEIREKHPTISRKELVQSGFNVGRQVIGTMATTLLLAYSGSYLTLLMLFMARSTSMVRMLNMKIVAAEIMRTVIGSVGLVLVAPLTALIAGIVMTWESESERSLEPEAEGKPALVKRLDA